MLERLGKNRKKSSRFLVFFEVRADTRGKGLHALGGSETTLSSEDDDKRRKLQRKIEAGTKR